MHISKIGNAFKGANFSRKKPTVAGEQIVNNRANQYDTFEIQKNIGDWRICLAENVYHGTKNLTVEKIKNGRDFYSISGHALEHNTHASEFGCAYGCFLDKNEKGKVDWCVKLFQEDRLTEKAVESLVSEIIEPALKKQGEEPLYF